MQYLFMSFKSNCKVIYSTNIWNNNKSFEPSVILSLISDDNTIYFNILLTIKRHSQQSQSYVSAHMYDIITNKEIFKVITYLNSIY